jgi:oligopeptidase B
VFETTKFRFGYSSLITPSSTFDFDMIANTKTLLHEKEVILLLYYSPA